MPSDSAGGTATEGTATNTPAMQAVELAVKAATAYERPDLAARARQALRRLQNPRVRVLVVGEFKQGKSMLVNALLNAPICPIDDDISTSVPTVVRYADTPSVTLVRAARNSGEDDEREERTQVPVEKLADYVSEAGNPGNRAGLKYAEVGVPRHILADGLELVDTPGVGGLGSVHGSATMAMMPSADAILLVSDAAAEYSRPELEFLRQAGRICPNVACVVTKIDLYPQWQRITELDRGHLATFEIDAELLPTSSVLRLHAVQSEDRALNAESGFPALVAFLRDRVVGQSGRLANRSAANDVVTIAGQLAAGMRAELAATEDPGGRPAQHQLALASGAERRHRRPERRRRLRPPGPDAQHRQGGREDPGRRGPGQALGPVRPAGRRPGRRGGGRDLPVGQRAGPLAGRPGGRAVRRGRGPVAAGPGR